MGGKRLHTKLVHRGWWSASGTGTRLGLAVSLCGALACGRQGDDVTVEQVTSASTDLATKIDPNTIPKFQTQLQRFPTYVPTVTRNGSGQITQKSYNVSIAQFTAQQLPA